MPDPSKEQLYEALKVVNSTGRYVVFEVPDSMRDTLVRLSGSLGLSPGRTALAMATIGAQAFANSCALSQAAADDGADGATKH